MLERDLRRSIDLLLEETAIGWWWITAGVRLSLANAPPRPEVVLPRLDLFSAPGVRRAVWSVNRDPPQLVAGFG